MNNIRKGMMCIILAAFFFAAMNVFVKLAGDLPSNSKSFFRNLVAALFAFFILLKSKQGFTYKQKDLPMLLLRSVFGTLGILCNFYAVDHLLVSDASMLNKLSPFFVIICSSLFLKEKATRIQKISIIVAFIGSLFVIKPSFNLLNNVDSIIGVLGARSRNSLYLCAEARQAGGKWCKNCIFLFMLFLSQCVTIFNN